MKSVIKEIVESLELLAIPAKRDFYPKFFKSGKGEYAEGDVFIGVTVPDQRKISMAFWRKITLSELAELLASPIHEHRHISLLMLVEKYKKANFIHEKNKLVEFYLSHKTHINNWDLVDTSCYKILGCYSFETKKDHILRQLASEESLWSKRMAIVSTMYYLKKGSFELLKELALQNLLHPHDLMHKANGWLLREMGKQDESELLGFLKAHYQKMPRTCLRYAIEKLDEPLRQDFLKSRI